MTGRLLGGPGLALVTGLLAVALAAAAAASPVLAMAGLVTAGVGAAVLLRPDLVMLMLVAALPWEGALQYPSPTLSVVKLIGGLLTLAWLWRLALGTHRLRLPASLIPVGLFGLSVVISLVLSPETSDGLGKTVRYASFIIFLFLVVQLVRDREQIRWMIRVFVISATAAAAWTLYRFLILHALERAAGPITDPNEFGYLQACVLPLAGYLVAAEPRRRLLWSLCFALMCGAVLASLSRGALVGLGGLLLWAVLTRKVSLRGVLIGVATVFALGALAFTIWSPLIHDRLQNHSEIAQQNVNTRFAFWSGAIRMWEDHPIVGIGVDRFGLEAPNYVVNSQIALERPAAHNAYLEILAEQGGLGLLTFAAFLISTWVLLNRGRRAAQAADDIDGVRLATAMQGTLVVAMVAGGFISAELTMPFWIIGGLAAVVAGLQARPPAPALAPA
jgi:putative inorganic carbon (hco3(-)) transporter